MAPILVKAFDGIDQTARQIRPRDALVAPGMRAEVGPVGCFFQRVRDHQIRFRLQTRALGNIEKALVINSYFELKFDKHTGKPPLFANQVDQLGSTNETEPKLRFIALDLGGLW